MTTTDRVTITFLKPGNWPELPFFVGYSWRQMDTWLVSVDDHPVATIHHWGPHQCPVPRNVSGYLLIIRQERIRLIKEDGTALVLDRWQRTYQERKGFSPIWYRS
jgi:hypothetical protein